MEPPVHDSESSANWGKQSASLTLALTQGQGGMGHTKDRCTSQQLHLWKLVALFFYKNA